MLHIATVHFKTDRWIEIQLKYLHRHLNTDYRVYACVPEPMQNYRDRFYFTSDYEFNINANFTDMNLSHPKKLNYLANVILEEASDEDYLIFLDGDAFPIANIYPFIKRTLSQFNLTAVRRDENGGDKQPHPCFCATTAGFWRKIGGDWSPGFTWKNNVGAEVTDVGGNLLGLLEGQGISWYPMLRSNKINLHPLWFGIYESLIYHHGAGFRPPISRIDLYDFSGDIGKFSDSSQYSQNLALMERVFCNIQGDENFNHEFIKNSSSETGIFTRHYHTFMQFIFRLKNNKSNQ